MRYKHKLKNFTCSILTVNGPFDWHSGQDPTLTSEYEFWKNGPRIIPHLLQSYFTCCNCGKTPERRVTTPPIRIMVFKWICLESTKHWWTWNPNRTLIRCKVSENDFQVTVCCVSDHKPVSWWCGHRSFGEYFCSLDVNQRQHSWLRLPWPQGQIEGHQPAR